MILDSTPVAGGWIDIFASWLTLLGMVSSILSPLEKDACLLLSGMVMAHSLLLGL
jgi:hypothetical protein